MFTQDPFDNLDPFELIMNGSYQFIQNAICYNFKNSANSFGLHPHLYQVLRMKYFLKNTAHL